MCFDIYWWKTIYVKSNLKLSCWFVCHYSRMKIWQRWSSWESWFIHSCLFPYSKLIIWTYRLPRSPSKYIDYVCLAKYNRIVPIQNPPWQEGPNYQKITYFLNSSSNLSIFDFILPFLSLSFSNRFFHSSAVSSSLTATIFLIVFARLPKS